MWVGPTRRRRAIRTARELDDLCGPRQFEHRSNFRSHARQPSRCEREWRRRDASHRSENDRVRACVAKRAGEVARMAICDNRPRELARRLRGDGIEMTRAKSGDLQFRFRSKSLERSGRGTERRVNGATLGRAVSRSGRELRLDLGSMSRSLSIARLLERDAERAADDGFER